MTPFSLILATAVSLASFADTDLRPQLSPVGDQAYRNTCTAFEAVTLAEFLLKEHGAPYVAFSPNYTYWATKTLSLNNDYLRENYAHIDGAPGYLAVEALNQGLMKESDWPYAPESDASLGKAGCKDENAPTVCFTGTPPALKPVTPFHVTSVFVPREQIRGYIETKKRPVLLNIHWYFDLVDKKGNVRMPTKAESQACVKSGQGCGGHMVMLTGYRSHDRRFLFRSSWGPEWGDGGYGTLPEEFVLKHCELCEHLDDKGLSPGERDLVTKGSQGVTAELAD